jgi:hypothetical protein
VVHGESVCRLDSHYLLGLVSYFYNMNGHISSRWLNAPRSSLATLVTTTTSTESIFECSESLVWMSTLPMPLQALSIWSYWWHCCCCYWSSLATQWGTWQSPERWFAVSWISYESQIPATLYILLEREAQSWLDGLVVWCALAKIYEEKSDCKTTWCALAKIYRTTV